MNVRQEIACIVHNLKRVFRRGFWVFLSYREGERAWLESGPGSLPPRQVPIRTQRNSLQIWETDPLLWGIKAALLVWRDAWKHTSDFSHSFISAFTHAFPSPPQLIFSCKMVWPMSPQTQPPKTIASAKIKQNTLVDLASSLFFVSFRKTEA